MIAEPWDLGAYMLGDSFPDPTWLQWNDRFRDEVRGFVRGETGSGARSDRSASPAAPTCSAVTTRRSVNFVTAHDGLTMHDLTVVTDDHFHSWDCGDSLRLQQLKNYFTLLLLSAGAAMFVMGDEVGRTQGGTRTRTTSTAR